MNTLSKIVLTAAALFTASSALAELNCKATYRKVTTQNKVTENVVPLAMTMDQNGMQKFEADLEQGLYMSATYMKDSNEVMLAITQAPDYTNGVITRAALSDGRASLGQTVMETEKGERTGNLLVYRVECSL
jgi:hypothetical protein